MAVSSLRQAAMLGGAVNGREAKRAYPPCRLILAAQAEQQYNPPAGRPNRSLPVMRRYLPNGLAI